MEATEAMKLAREFGAIPKFPSWSEPAVGAVADAIAEWCDSPEDAMRLIRAAVRVMPEWQGVPALKAIFEGQHQEKTVWHGGWHPVDPSAPYDPGPGDGSGCEACNFTGALIEWHDKGWSAKLCACAAGVQGAIRHVAALNSESARQAHRFRGRVQLRATDHGRIDADLNTLEHVSARPAKEAPLMSRVMPRGN